MNILTQNDKLLRYLLALTFLAHSLPTILDGSIYLFGTEYLDKQGFAPFGLYLAWLIKLMHMVCAVCLIIYRFLFWPMIFNLLVLILGIFMVHLPEGWFVVGGGRNGIEFNILIIGVMIHVLINYHSNRFSRMT